MNLEDLKKLCADLPLPPADAEYSDRWINAFATAAKALPKLIAVAEAAKHCLSKDHILSDLIYDAMRTVDLQEALAALESSDA